MASSRAPTLKSSKSLPRDRRKRRSQVAKQDLERWWLLLDFSLGKNCKQH